MAASDLRYISGDVHRVSEVSIVLLGCRNSGKSLAGNVILGLKDLDLQESTWCVKRHGEVAGRKITLVEAPGWCSDKPVTESTELLNEEIVCGVSVCPPGPQAVLVVVNCGDVFKENDRERLAGCLNLLGDEVWSHTIVLFTFGDFLGDVTIERHIEREGVALQWLVEKCGNRYHVFKNNMDDNSQVMELLEKIEEMVARNRGCHLEMDTTMLPNVDESRREDESKERRMKEDFREPSGTGKGAQSTSTLHPDAGHVSADTEIFTPELVDNYPNDKNRMKYRFFCSRAGQFKCKLTDLVFEMEGKGEVLYRIVSWDGYASDELKGKEPAGPLYSIDCLEGSIRHLHLPHCEIDWSKYVLQLTTAHVTGGNVEIIQPLKLTSTHVIVDVRRFSLVGLLKALLFQAYPIRAQVLLFCEETGKHRMSKLHIHLLPGNVPVEEVQKQRNCTYTCIETRSKCQLTPDKTYRPCFRTTDSDYVSQPEDETFVRDYGPDYHPTFEVQFNTELDKFTLSLLDENGQEVWRPDLALLTEGFREHDGTGKDARSAATLHLDSGHVSADTEIFTPELVDNYPNDKNRMKYRFFCSRAGQFKCKLTDLVFEMEGKGEVLYRIVSWDGCASDELKGKEPAGPLYSIDCLEGSIRHLHLPHCEIDWSKYVLQLTTAHVTGGNVEIIQPLKLTSTHVIVDVRRFSLVGLLKALLFQAYPIRAQVLLFCEETGKHRMSKLHIHLLPGNVPVEEVQKQRNCTYTYIETRSKCQLTPDKTYRPCFRTTDSDYVSQPEDETFVRDYGPDYHPTFEVQFNTELDKFTLSLLDENGQEVWRPDLALLTEGFREHDGTGKDARSAATLHLDSGHASADTELIFSPELVENCPKDKNRVVYSFLCPHAGLFMCKLTNLVFEMEGKGVVVYRIVSWDSCVSDGLQKDSAGPLYSIECLEGSIRHLHLPHCETRTDVVKLTVAHATGGNVEIIQPLKITDTHVIIHIHGLSLFGILKALLFQEYPIRAQVLLFRKKMTGKLSRSKLNIHLLPGNVPVKEVQKQRKCNENIETTSKCQLTPGKLYRLCCKTTDRDYEPQPEEETFDLDYGPNYHPTFEVLFNTELDEITLSLLDENGQEVWTPREVSLLTDTEAVSANTDKAGADFVDKHRETLIQSVPSVIEIADVLKGKKMISDEMYYKIKSKEIGQEQMRELYRCLTSTAVKAEFYKILQEKHQYILEDL